MPKYSQRERGDIRTYAHRESEIREFVTTRLAQKHTFKQVRDLLEQQGVVVTVRTLYNWCRKWNGPIPAGTPDAE